MGDDFKGSINSLYHIKQVLEAFALDFKGTISPSNIHRHILTIERDGVISSKVGEVNCTITKAGNERGMCTFYYCSHPAQLLAAMFCCMYLDNACRNSQIFSSLANILVVLVGFKKK